MTAFPPPHGNPATASLNVIASDNFSASASASTSDAYRCRRVPPVAGPSACEWNAVKIQACNRGNARIASSSPSQAERRKSNRSNSVWLSEGLRFPTIERVSGHDVNLGAHQRRSDTECEAIHAAALGLDSR
jgi:hypothetical protein